MSAVKVNLGSGFVGLDGWLNYDNSALARIAKCPFLLRMVVKLGVLDEGFLEVKWPKIICHDVRRGLPLRASSVDFVYSSHFLEHLFRYETYNVLKECLRVLKPGSWMRIVLPDLDRVIKLYEAGDSDALLNGWGEDKCEPTMSDYMMSVFYPHDFNKCERPSLAAWMSEKFQRRHKWMYSVDSMTALLKKVGFDDVRERAYRESVFEECVSLDRHEKMSFFLEAKKGESCS